MDEHSTEHIEMDERLPYRLGSPILAPMPLRAVRTTPFEGYGTLWPIIGEIIKAENITLEAGYYCSKRILRWCDDADVKTTILFKGDMKEMVKWKAALQQLRTAVDKVSKDIFIEFIDSGAVEGLALWHYSPGTSGFAGCVADIDERDIWYHCRAPLDGGGLSCEVAEKRGRQRNTDGRHYSWRRSRGGLVDHPYSSNQGDSSQWSRSRTSSGRARVFVLMHLGVRNASKVWNLDRLGARWRIPN
jgi:hypothetical protein